MSTASATIGRLECTGTKNVVSYHPLSAYKLPSVNFNLRLELSWWHGSGRTINISEWIRTISAIELESVLRLSRSFGSWILWDCFVRSVPFRSFYGNSHSNAFDRRGYQEVAIKCVDLRDGHCEGALILERTLREVDTLKLLRGEPHIIKVLETFYAKPQQPVWNIDLDRDVRNQLSCYLASKRRFFCIVMELMDFTLRAAIRSNKINVGIDGFRQTLHKILLGVKAMHAADICHRDLKPDNILLSSHGDVRICDFNLARFMPSGFQWDNSDLPKMTAYVTTQDYRPPEISLSNTYNGKSLDMWSIGCIMAEMLAGNGNPFFYKADSYPPDAKYGPYRHLSKIFRILGTPSEQFFKNVKNARKLEVCHIKEHMGKSLASYFPSATAECLDLLSSLLQYDPDKRCTVDEALKHPFFCNLPPQNVDSRDSAFKHQIRRSFGTIVSEIFQQHSAKI